MTKNEILQRKSRRSVKYTMLSKMIDIVKEIIKGENYVIWSSTKTTVHIIPDGKLKEMIKEVVEGERKRIRIALGQKLRASDYYGGYPIINSDDVEKALTTPTSDEALQDNK